jgi:hypothetical protein
MNLPFLSGVVLSFVRVLGSTVVGEHSAVLFGGEGAVDDVDDPLKLGASDTFTDAEALGSLGLVVRPRPPETIQGKVLGAEGIGARLGSSTVPLGLRDLRLNRRFGSPKPGSVALVGYGGGFLAFDDTDSKETRATLYVPYSFAGGFPAKAMTIAIDPEAESMMLVHGDGYAVVLDKDNGITLRGDGSTWLRVGQGKIEMVAASISARGIVALGADTSAAVPLLPSLATQPTPSVFFSAV